MTDMTGGDNGGQATETDQLIERFGGIRPMAAKLGIPVTTVQGWKKRGHIPENRHEEILAAATRLGLTVRLTPGGGADEDAAPAAPAAAAPPVSEGPLPEAQASGGVAPDADGPAPVSVAAGTAPLSAAAPSARTSSREDPPFQSQPHSLNQASAQTQAPAQTRAAPPPRTGRGLAVLALVAALAGSGGSAVWASYRAGDFDSLLGRASDDADSAPDPHDAAVDAALAQLAQRQTDLAQSQSDLAGKLAALEQRLAAAPAGDAGAGAAPVPVTPAPAAPASATPAPAVLPAEVAQHIDDLTQQLARMTERQHALEQALTGIQGEASQAGRQVGAQLRAQLLLSQEVSGTARALVLGVGQLRTALESGGPYEAELSSVRALLTASVRAGVAADGGISTEKPLDTTISDVMPLLDRLEENARTGLPTMAELRTGFDAAAAEAVQADRLAAGGSWFDKLLARLRGLVTVRRKDGQVAGGGADAVTNRAAAKLAGGDLNAALGELTALPAAADTPGIVAWRHRAEMRQAADDVIARLNRRAIAGLAAVPAAPGAPAAPSETAAPSGAPASPDTPAPSTAPVPSSVPVTGPGGDQP